MIEYLIAIVERLYQACRSRYVKELERRVGELERRNKALIDSLLGTAGFAPVLSVEPSAPVTPSKSRPVLGARNPHSMLRTLERQDRAQALEQRRRLAELREQKQQPTEEAHGSQEST